ncbi:MAG: C45 family peptidase [Gemmataceae bacterium]|nr:C45 family peptidase [Gemmataceae bacterium]
MLARFALLAAAPLLVVVPAGQAAPPTAAAEVPPAVVIAGTPKERGAAYGKQFHEGIRKFLDQEIYGAFIQKPSPKPEMLRYAAACGEVIAKECPEIHQELLGVAEGSGLTPDEVVLITLHEELYHRGVLPKVPHCTAVAVGPPDTADGKTYVGQTWDWMETVAGWSSVVEWRRTEGPSLLAYGFPGLPVGAGVNANGIALCWTSADLGAEKLGVRVGLPSYVLLTHLLYQKDLDAVEAAAKRDQHAGWFTFVLADGAGNLLNVEGSPKGVVVERAKGHMARVSYGSRAMTQTPDGQPVKFQARCQKMYDLLRGSAGKADLRTLQGFFADPKCEISVGKATIDMMVFDCTDRTAYLSRGPSYKTDWKVFRFGAGR